MRSSQLHHVSQLKPANRVYFQSRCLSHRYGAYLGAIHPSTQRSLGITSKNAKVQIVWCIPVVNFRRKASSKGDFVVAYASTVPIPYKEIIQSTKSLATSSCTSLIKAVHGNRVVQQCAPAVGLIVFAMWGLGPILQFIHRAILHNEGRSWKGSQLNHIMRMYVRPILLWIGVILICRACDPIVLSTEASQAIKQRFTNFVRSLSTVLAFGYCTNSVIQQLHKVMLDQRDIQDSRSLGAQFVGNAVYTAVWIAALCLFMELLGFSTQKWLTAGGVGTLLLTLAGREIFTNFLSSIMIHATQPFVLNEWIQTKIDGYEVSGTVEHVGWWSPTIVRGDDREAVHIPNHKFTVSVVRNLSQKSHWRIKTYFGISHLDVSKIPNIVADMRKVLAKHPQVEQKRLHRRVFFESVNPENQALMVLVSCFVKTPHFEEYLHVKEVILLDLMKVISYHQARLATPIRSIQRVLDDIEPRANRGPEAQAKLYLIEASSVANVSRDIEQSGSPNNGPTQAKYDTVNSDGTCENENSTRQVANTLNENQSKDMLKNGGTPKTEDLSEAADSTVMSKHKSQLEGLDSMGLNSNDITLLGAAYEKPPAKIPDDPLDSRVHSDSFKMTPDTGPGRGEKKSSTMTAEQTAQHRRTKSDKLEKNLDKTNKATNVKLKLSQEESNNGGEEHVETDTLVQQKADVQEAGMRRAHNLSASGDVDWGISGVHSVGNKAPLEENIVLGVALNGPKQTLPLDSQMTPGMEHKELVGSSNGSFDTAIKDGPQSSNAIPLESR